MRVALKVRARCGVHKKYDPAVDRAPSPGSKNKECRYCDRMWVIFLYSNIARSAAREIGALIGEREEPDDEPESQA